jgi:hypothetical protein
MKFPNGCNLDLVNRTSRRKDVGGLPCPIGDKVTWWPSAGSGRWSVESELLEK